MIFYCRIFPFPINYLIWNGQFSRTLCAKVASLPAQVKAFHNSDEVGVHFRYKRKSANCIQRMQNSFLRLIYGIEKYHHTQMEGNWIDLNEK